MLRRTLTLAAVAIGIAVGFATPAAHAQAGAQCDQIVFDDARLFGARTGEVERTARDLNGIGADTRVVTIPSLNRLPTLDAYIDDTVKRCPSWRNSNGGRKTNLLVFAQAPNERKVGIFFGDRWKAGFNQAGGEQRIWSGVMAPDLKANNFSQAFINGMNETKRVLTAPVGSNTTPAVVKQPTNLTGLWVVLGLLVLLLALGAGIYFFVRSRNQRQAADEDRQATRQRALRARDAASLILQELRGATEVAVRDAKVARYAKAGGNNAGELNQALRDVNTHSEQATTKMASAASASGTADDTNLSTSVYEQLAARYDEVLDHAQQAQRANNRINELTAEIDRQLAQVGTLIAEGQSRIDAVNRTVDSLQSEGVRVDDGVNDDLAAALVALEAAEANQSDLSALEHLGTAATHLDRAEAAVRTINEQRQQLARGIPELEQRIARVYAAVTPAHAVFDRVMAAYARSSWRDAEGNEATARGHIGQASSDLDLARQQADMSRQEWANALTLLKTGNEGMDEAERLLDELTKLEANLARARGEAPQQVRATQDVVTRADDFIRAHQGDIRDDLNGQLQAARNIADEAQGALSATQPDYLQVIRQAERAHTAANQVYFQAVAQAEAAERIRREAREMLQEARTAVDNARSLIQGNRSDVSSTAENQLEQAIRTLTHAEGSRNPEAILRDATTARDEANTASRRARRDIEESENERRRRRNDSSGYGGGYGGYPGSTTVIVTDTDHHHGYGHRDPSPGYGGGSSGGYDSGDYGGSGSSGDYGGSGSSGDY